MNLGILLLRLENAIKGHEICLETNCGDDDTKDMLNLLRECYEVISRIEVVEEEQWTKRLWND